MTRRDDWFRHSRAVRDKARWKVARLEALRRDNFRCTQCGAVAPLEVHHTKSVRRYPESAYDVDTLLTLCRSCHTRATREELGQKPMHPERVKWAALLRGM